MRSLGGLVRKVVKPKRAFSTSLGDGVKNVVATGVDDKAAAPADDEEGVGGLRRPVLRPKHTPVDVARLVDNLAVPDTQPAVHVPAAPKVHRLPTGGVVTQHPTIAGAVIEEQLARTFSRRNILRFHASGTFALEFNREDQERMALFDANYELLGGMDPEEWVPSFAKAVDEYGNAFPNWDLVPDNGAYAGWKRTLIRKNTFWDRFGDGTGSYLALAGTDYTSRAIAPISMTKPFTRYRVAEDIPEELVMFSQVLPWFNERGMGDQIWFTRDGKKGIPVDEMVARKYLVEASPPSLGPSDAMLLAAALAADSRSGDRN